MGGRPRLRRPEPRDYAINRYYSPETGRFTTHDPLTELDRPERLNQPQGLNLYPYVMGAPTRYSDPDGRDWWYRGEPEGSDWYLEWRDDDRTHIGEIGLAAMGFKRVTENQLFKAAYKQLGNDIVALNPSVRTFEIAFSKPPEVGPIGGIRLPAMEFPLAECVSVGLQMMSVIQDPRLARIVADTTVETGVAIVTYPKRMVKSLVGLPEALKTAWDGYWTSLSKQRELIDSGDYAGYAKASFALGWDVAITPWGLPSTTTLSDPNTFLKQMKNPQFFIDKTIEFELAIGGGAIAGRAGNSSGLTRLGLADDGVGTISTSGTAAEAGTVARAGTADEIATAPAFNRNAVKQGFQDHHIISDKSVFTKEHEILDAAGFDLQSRANKIFLPERAELHPTRSIHNGRHLNSVSERLAEQMDAILEHGRANSWTQQQYHAELMRVIMDERRLLKSGQRRLNRVARPRSE